MENTKPDTVFDFFQATVNKFPDKDFQRIKKEGTFYGVTYQEAYDTVLEIGTGLMSFGVNKEDKVGLICDIRPEWILVNLALQGIGAPDVPRDVDVPLPTLEAIVDDSQPRFMIVENQKTLEKVNSIRDTFPFISEIFLIEGQPIGKNVHTLPDVINEGRARLKQGDNSFLEAAQRISTDDTSAIVYTSGTQGNPKGVIITHSNFAYQFEVVPPLWNLNENDRVLCFLPPWHLLERAVEYFIFVIGGSMSYTTTKDLIKDLALEKPTFIASVPRVWTALYARAQKQISRQRPPLNNILASLVEKSLRHKRDVNIRNNRYPGPSYYDESDIIESAKDRAIHLISYKIADLLVFSKIRKMLGGELRGAVFGGGHLPEHVEDFLDAAGLDVLEAYGMTEAAPVLTVRKFGGTLYTAGEPLPGTEVQILDRYLDPVDEPGKPGVIFGRGPQIMKGYTSEELTSRVLSPSSDGHPLKWYNTGDIGLITQSGDLKILGRARDDFKLLNAEWVTPQPIEDVISTSEYVNDVMVVGHDQKFVGALIFPEWDNLKRFVREYNIKYPTDDKEAAYMALSRDEQIKSLIETEIRAKWFLEEEKFNPWEEPVRFAIIPREPRIGSELTATLKIRRHFVMEEYKSVIEELFS